MNFGRNRAQTTSHLRHGVVPTNEAIEHCLSSYALAVQEDFIRRSLEVCVFMPLLHACLLAWINTYFRSILLFCVLCRWKQASTQYTKQKHRSKVSIDPGQKASMQQGHENTNFQSLSNKVLWSALFIKQNPLGLQNS